MSLPPLATINDVTSRLPSGVSIDENRAISLIRDASATVRRYTKQDFTIGTTIANIRPIGYRLRLPQRPVLDVISIEIKLPGSQPGTYTSIPSWYWDGSDEVWLVDGSAVVNLAEEIISAVEYMTPVCRVTWQHGYTEVPDDIVGVVCSMVNRLITAPGLGGVISETVGEFSYRLSDAAAQGPMTLTQSEKDILNDYRPKGGRTVELRG
jgi:hypothetical protein